MKIEDKIRMADAILHAVSKGSSVEVKQKTDGSIVIYEVKKKIVPGRE